MSTVYQQLADDKKAEIQNKADMVHEIAAKVDALDSEIREHHEHLRQKNQERGELSRQALELLSEIVA